MTQIATVEKKLGAGYVEISVPRKSACGHDCEECAGCGMTGICHSEGPQNPLLSAYRHDHPSGQSPQYPGSFSGGDSASEHGCEIGKR